MRVTVELFGPARESAGTSQLEISFEAPCSAQEIVVRLAHEHGDRLAKLLLHDGRLSNSIMIAVNDRQAMEPVPLHDGDVVTVIPPVSGGAR